MSHFIVDQSIQELPASHRLSTEDLFIVSRKYGDKYVSEKVSYGELVGHVGGYLSVGDLSGKIDKNSADIAKISSDFSELSGKFDTLSLDFDEKKVLID